jgi:hypothetical protein
MVPPSGISGSAFCTVKSVPFTLTPNTLSKWASGDLFQRHEFTYPAFGE